MTTLFAERGIVEIRFPYEEDTIRALRLCAGAKWSKTHRVWESPGIEVVLDMQRFGIPYQAGDEKTRTMLELFHEQVRNIISVQSEMHSGAYGFQNIGTKSLVTMEKGIMADDMGLGKTKQALDATQIVCGELVLIVTLKTLVYNWAAEIEKWHPGEKWVIVDGPPKVREEQLKAPARFFIVNYEKLGLHNFVAFNFDTLIFDEATKVKNSQTQMYRNIKKIAKGCKYVYPLTGTPLEMRLEELHSIMSLTRPAVLGDYWKFRDQHLVLDYFSNVRGAKNLKLLRERIAPWIIRREKKDVLHELPDKIYNTVWVELSKEEWQDYGVLDYLTSDNVLTQILRFRQYTCHPAVLGYGTPSSKLAELKRIIDEWEGQVLVFSDFAEVTKVIHRELKCHEDAYIDGSITSAKERLRRVSAFNDGLAGKVFVQTDAGAFGLNITSANLVIHYSLLWNPGKMKQREDRAHRIGQKDVVNVIYLMAKGTVDEGMFLVLQERQKLFEVVIDEASDIISNVKIGDIKELVNGRYIPGR